MTGTADRTCASCAYEWTTFDRIHDEDEEYWRAYHADEGSGWHVVVEKPAPASPREPER